MKKLSIFFLVVIGFFMLEACSLQVKEITAETFKQGRFESTEKDTTIRSIVFEEDRVIVSLDFKKNKRFDTISKYLSSQYGLSWLLHDSAPDFYKEDIEKGQVTLRGFKQGVHGYQDRYGEFYVVFYNPTLYAPDEHRNSWKVDMQWDKEKGKDPRKDEHMTYLQTESIFLFTVDEQQNIIDQFGGRYKYVN